MDASGFGLRASFVIGPSMPHEAHGAEARRVPVPHGPMSRRGAKQPPRPAAVETLPTQRPGGDESDRFRRPRTRGRSSTDSSAGPLAWVSVEKVMSQTHGHRRGCHATATSIVARPPPIASQKHEAPDGQTRSAPPGSCWRSRRETWVVRSHVHSQPRATVPHPLTNMLGDLPRLGICVHLRFHMQLRFSVSSASRGEHHQCLISCL